MRVTHNAVIDFIRRRKTKHGVFDDAAEVEEQAGDDDQHCAAETAAIRGDIAAAIRELDDPFRSILVMRDVQGLAYADIEVSLEMNASQVKVYLHRARRKLRQNAQLRQRFDDLD
jgi:RNA polymerase sigma-70 factor (ECF subfamily)